MPEPATVTAYPEIKITRADQRQLESLLAEHAPIRSWRAVEFLVRELDRAIIVDDSETPRNVVTMHSRFEYRDDSSGATHVATLVYPGERHLYDDGISVVTPVGAALIGLAEGQSLTYPAPDGGLKSITVTRLLYQPEAARRAARTRRGTSAERGRTLSVNRPTAQIVDESGHLKPLHHKQICARLNAAGYWGPVRQSRLLAEQLDHDNDAEIWAILMWNARPSKSLAKKLLRWIAAGMPLSGRGSDGKAVGG